MLPKELSSVYPL